MEQDLFMLQTLSLQQTKLVVVSCFFFPFLILFFPDSTLGRHYQSIAHWGLKLGMGHLWGGHILLFEG